MQPVEYYGKANIQFCNVFSFLMIVQWDTHPKKYILRNDNYLQVKS